MVWYVKWYVKWHGIKTPELSKYDFISCNSPLTVNLHLVGHGRTCIAISLTYSAYRSSNLKHQPKDDNNTQYITFSSSCFLFTKICWLKILFLVVIFSIFCKITVYFEKMHWFSFTYFYLFLKKWFFWKINWGLDSPFKNVKDTTFQNLLIAVRNKS